MSDPLFHDGWRDPGDDFHRTIYFVSWVLGFIAGFALTIYSLGLIIRHGSIQMETWPGYQSSIPGLPLWLSLLGILTMARTGLKLYPELKRLRKARLTADAFVAGGFLAGLALIVLGLERTLWADGRPSSVASLVILGAIVLVASLLFGFAVSLLPRIQSIPRTISNTTVETRYAIDKKLMEIYDHPNPVDEGCIAMVSLKTPDGKVLTLRAGAVAYELASPGSRGTATVAGTRLRSFQPSRRA